VIVVIVVVVTLVKKVMEGNLLLLRSLLHSFITPLFFHSETLSLC
jgi:hypothetical protein